MPDDTQEQLAQEVHAAGTRLGDRRDRGRQRRDFGLARQCRGPRDQSWPPRCPMPPRPWSSGSAASRTSSARPRTARAMAMAAYLKAQAYDPQRRTLAAWPARPAWPATDRSAGPHRAHLAFQTATTTATHFAGARKRAPHPRRGRSGRRGPGAQSGGRGLRYTRAASMCRSSHSETVANRRVSSPRAISKTCWPGRVRAVRVAGARRSEAAKGHLARRVQSAARRPSQDGRAGRADSGRARWRSRFRSLNVDKPPLDFIEIDRRVAAVRSRTRSVWLSRAPHFSEKAELFPGATFVVGADTIARIGDPRYYGGQEAAMRRPSRDIAAHGCRFLVFGRPVDGAFRTLSAICRFPSR